MATPSPTSNVVSSCKYRVVWCPKYRRKVLIDGVDTRLIAIIQECAEEIEYKVIEIEVMPDHVHLLIEVDPQFGIHRAVKAIKGQTSHLLRQEFPVLKRKLPTLWTNSYFVATIGSTSISEMAQYIESQKNV